MQTKQNHNLSRLATALLAIYSVIAAITILGTLAAYLLPQEEIMSLPKIQPLNLSYDQVKFLLEKTIVQYIVGISYAIFGIIAFVRQNTKMIRVALILGIISLSFTILRLATSIHFGNLTASFSFVVLYQIIWGSYCVYLWRRLKLQRHTGQPIA